VYIIILLRLTVFRFTTIDERSINLSLFSDLIQVYQNHGFWRFFWLFGGNIGWFVPFGFLLPQLKKLSFAKTLLCGFLFSLSIETIQFIFRIGFAELDDLILNTTGVAIGYALLLFANKIMPKLNLIKRASND